MSYTENINYQETCNYINPEKDNAISMLKTCINDPTYKPIKKDLNPGDFCNGQPQDIINYGFSDNYPLENLNENKTGASVHKNHINKLQDDLLQYLSSNNNKYLTEINNDNKIDFDGYWTGDDTKRAVDFRESKPNFPNFVPPKKILLTKNNNELKDNKSNNIEYKNNKLIEGFTTGDFYSDNGPGRTIYRCMSR